jgi:hypothetical protein
MREYLKSIGALDHFSIDFKYDSDNHRERRVEEKYPYRKGASIRHIRNMAFLKGMPS